MTSKRWASLPPHNAPFRAHAFLRSPSVKREFTPEAVARLENAPKPDLTPDRSRGEQGFEAAALPAPPFLTWPSFRRRAVMPAAPRPGAPRGPKHPSTQKKASTEAQSTTLRSDRNSTLTSAHNTTLPTYQNSTTTTTFQNSTLSSAYNTTQTNTTVYIASGRTTGFRTAAFTYHSFVAWSSK